jgi:hypothetical protein
VSGVLDAFVRCLAEGEPLVATGSGDDDLVDPDIRQICQYWIGTDRVLVPPGSSCRRSGAGFPASRVLPSLSLGVRCSGGRTPRESTGSGRFGSQGRELAFCSVLPVSQALRVRCGGHLAAKRAAIVQMGPGLPCVTDALGAAGLCHPDNPTINAPLRPGVCARYGGTRLA